MGHVPVPGATLRGRGARKPRWGRDLVRGEAGVLLLGVVRELGGRVGAVTRPGLQRGVATLQTMEGCSRILEKAIL